MAQCVLRSNYLEQRVNKRTVCVDFDGVLHSYTSGWTGELPTDDPEPGAVDFVWRLLQDYQVVILTTRAQTPAGHAGVKAWLDRHGFPHPLTVTDKKVPAIAYVDDRAVPYDPGSGDWQQALLDVARLEHLGTTKGRGK